MMIFNSYVSLPEGIDFQPFFLANELLKEVGLQSQRCRVHSLRAERQGLRGARGEAHGSSHHQIRRWSQRRA